MEKWSNRGKVGGGIFSHNVQAVCHHVLAKIDPNKIDCLGEAAHQPPAGTGFQHLTGKYYNL